MLDLAAPKVAVPATLFMLASTFDATREFTAILVPLLSWIFIKFVLKLTLTRTDLITITLISGGLSLVPIMIDWSVEVVLKGVIFLFLFSYIRIAFPKYY